MRKVIYSLAHILVTNDDGISAPGLLALAQALRPLGQVTVLAPNRNWSASGHVKTLNRPLRVYETTLSDGTPALASDGAPSDCVALALLGLVAPVDLVVSGINPFANLGQDLTYSGTVAAALEAIINNKPAIAVSLHTQSGASQVEAYAAAADIARQLAGLILEHGLPPGIGLNVNVPAGPAEALQGVAITRQGRRIYRDQLVRRQDPLGRPYYWIGGQPPTGHPEEGTDIGALARNQVSITPLHLDLTAHAERERLKNWLQGIQLPKK